MTQVLCDACLFDACTLTWKLKEPTPFARCAHTAVALPSGEAPCSPSLVVLTQPLLHSAHMHADSFCILRPACGWQMIVAVVVQWYTAKSRTAVLLDLDQAASSILETPYLVHSGWL